MTILVTGAAGFIGHAVAHRLLDRGDTVVGIDIVNDYYDVALKLGRLETLAARNGFQFEKLDIADPGAVARLLAESGATRVVHLAAQAGVRYSLDNPFAYGRSNLAGHLAVLEACRHHAPLTHLVYASSSSVYGDRPLTGAGFREDDPTVSPVSLYAATKRSCELMSQSYATLFGFPQTGLRFFTVYGPWGRPDMAYFGFTQKILAGQPIQVFGEGKLARDFTYIDDIVTGILGALDHPPAHGAHRLLNIGNSRPETVLAMIEALEAALGRKAIMEMKPKPPGDVDATYADVSKLAALTGYAPSTSIGEGMVRFATWYRDFYR
ncbi:MAG: NAD-dependent epimerase/dehydratase family protein [Sphingomonas sp.]|nr:NAD-dependent epimerase/dehydratase family protein [Sphingomonas sp.]